MLKLRFLFDTVAELKPMYFNNARRINLHSSFIIVKHWQLNQIFSVINPCVGACSQALLLWKFPVDEFHLIFFMPAAASIIRSASCLLPYFHLSTVVHVILLATPEAEIYRLMSGDRTGHSAVLSFLTIIPDVSSLRCAVSCQNVEARRYVVSTFALLFQEARTSYEYWFILQKFLQLN